MTNTLPAPQSRRPWAHRTPRGTDLAFAIPLFLLESAWLVLDWMLGYGMDVWAAQGDRSHISSAGLALIDRVQGLSVVTLVMAVLAGVFRARWTVVAHLLVAFLAVGVIGAVQHQENSGPATVCVRYSANC
ncbi:DUF6234 family protein [Streptomyces sp. NPDC059991]|uniref:DUF6234 family protein n=1 Tax=Streptomyces sp. NPDC059991 TaxID=3347028 RepID=UPI0036BDC7F4